MQKNNKIKICLFSGGTGNNRFVQLLKDIRIQKPLDTTEIGDIRWLPIPKIIDFMNNMLLIGLD